MTAGLARPLVIEYLRCANIKMFVLKSFLVLHILHLSYGNWMSDWMAPIQDQMKSEPVQRASDARQQSEYSQQPAMQNFAPLPTLPPRAKFQVGSDARTIASLKGKLEGTVAAARELLETLRRQINEVAAQENLLKEAIANGRAGVTTVKVSTLNYLPRSYIVRDGRWFLCNGIVQTPVNKGPGSLFNQIMAAPKCIGHEVPSARDPCVFNSVTKYEVIPARRQAEYVEDEFLCLKPTFNNTMEQYLSVPKRVLNDTCTGTIRTVVENIQECGVRAMSEYAFFPHRSNAAAALPLEYCTEQNGACKLIVAWHVSNKTIENFEFLRSEPKFLEYFIRDLPYTAHVM